MKTYIYYYPLDNHQTSAELTRIGLRQYLREMGMPEESETVTIARPDKNGKPYIVEYPHIYHNVSHSGDWWVCAYGLTENGLDLQKVDGRNTEKITNRFLHSREKMWLRDKESREFFRIWAFKESYTKYTGCGLMKGLDYFSVIPEHGDENDSDALALGEASLVQREIPFPEEGYYLVLTTSQEEEVFLKPLMKEDLGNHYFSYLVPQEEEGSEILSILRGELSLTTRKIRSIKYHERGILLDDVKVTVRERVHGGQILRILKDDIDAEDRILPLDRELDILYEDQDLIFVNKPWGMVSHPSIGHKYDSLANLVKAYFLRCHNESGIHLIGRLDKDTSGLLGIAKNGMTKEHMIRERSLGNVTKEYLALVEGHLLSKEGTIDLPMEEYVDESDRFIRKMRTPQTGEGLRAITHYKVLEEGEDYSVVSLRLETGRMHQIRFHMAGIGHPLLGDKIYGHGEENCGLQRTALHAWKVRFSLPYRQGTIGLKAAIPMDLRSWIHKGNL